MIQIHIPVRSLNHAHKRTENLTVGGLTAFSEAAADPATSTDNATIVNFLISIIFGYQLRNDLPSPRYNANLHTNIATSKSHDDYFYNMKRNL